MWVSDDALEGEIVPKINESYLEDCEFIDDNKKPTFEDFLQLFNLKIISNKIAWILANSNYYHEQKYIDDEDKYCATKVGEEQKSILRQVHWCGFMCLHCH